MRVGRNFFVLTSTGRELYNKKKRGAVYHVFD